MLKAQARCPGFLVRFPSIQRVFYGSLPSIGIISSVQKSSAGRCQLVSLHVTGTSLLTALSPGLLSDETKRSEIGMVLLLLLQRIPGTLCSGLLS